MTPLGGTIMGYKAITSQSAGTTVALVQPSSASCTPTMAA